jgi:hypothetical protein
MDLTDDLLMALERMGTTADEVAATLRAKGVQGIRNAVRVLNPVIRYIQISLRQDNLDMDVMTGKTICLKSRNGVTIQVAAIPEAVRQFLDAFNRGAFPDLELPGDKT